MKKILSLALIAFLGLGVLVGCTSNEEPVVDEEETNEVVEEETNEVVEDDANVEAEAPVEADADATDAE